MSKFFWSPTLSLCGIDLSTKRHRLVHNGESPKLEAVYGSLNMVNSTEIS